MRSLISCFLFLAFVSVELGQNAIAFGYPCEDSHCSDDETITLGVDLLSHTILTSQKIKQAARTIGSPDCADGPVPSHATWELVNGDCPAWVQNHCHKDWAQRACAKTCGACTLCTLGEWGAWSECSATCGGGGQIRTRDAGECTAGELTEAQQCNTQDCAFDTAILLASDPLVIENAHDTVIENLHISTDGSEPGITVQDSSNVVIRNVFVEHTGAQQCRSWQDCHTVHGMPVVDKSGVGIYFQNASGIRIEQVTVELRRTPNPYVNGSINAKCGDTYCGPFPDTMKYAYNIEGRDSPNAVIENVHLKGGSSGLWTSGCDDMLISHIKVENVHGPYPRGQCFQLTRSSRIMLEDFYCYIDNDIGYTEDAISIWESEHATLQRGVIDGGNAPTGVGVMFERGHHGVCQDVDISNNGKGGFSNYGSNDVQFLRTRAKNNHGPYSSCKTGRGYCTDLTGNNWCEGDLDGYELAGGNRRDDSGGGIWYSGDYNSNIGDGSHGAQASNTQIVQGQFWNMTGWDPNADSCVDVVVGSWQVSGATRQESYTVKDVVMEDFDLWVPYNAKFEEYWTFQ